MNLPQVLTTLVAAQSNSDSSTFTNCFSETAIVFDEGKTHSGKRAIENWIVRANKTYKTVMKPLNYSPTQQTLEAEISGTFPGSPITLEYHFEIAEGLIQSLRITGS